MQSFKNIVIVAIIVNLLQIALILLLQNHLPPLLPLFYGLPVSEGQLVNQKLLTIPPIVSIILSLVNFSLAKFTKDKFIEKISLGLIAIITILSLITITKIISQVGSF